MPHHPRLTRVMVCLLSDESSLETVLEEEMAQHLGFDKHDRTSWESPRSGHTGSWSQPQSKAVTKFSYPHASC